MTPPPLELFKIFIRFGSRILPLLLICYFSIDHHVSRSYLHSRHPDSPLTGPTMFAIPRPCWLHKSCSANLTHVILKILLFEEQISTSGPEVLVNTCDPPFTILDICNDLLTHVLKVIKRRFYMSKTFWPRCRLIWTASWRFCMNSFGQRWQRNSWKVHRNILYYSIFSILKV